MRTVAHAPILKTNTSKRARIRLLTRSLINSLLGSWESEQLDVSAFGRSELYCSASSTTAATTFFSIPLPILVQDEAGFQVSNHGLGDI